jgi:uncharacterized SAM-binding protein YcdF (DUF218 family)
MGHQSNWAVLGKQLRRGVMGVIRPENVFLETESANTTENAAVLVNYARAHHWERILLVTSRYHMKRARFIFEAYLASTPAIGVETLSVYQEPFEPGEWRAGGLHGIRVTVLEYLKWLYYKSFWKPQSVQ